MTTEERERVYQLQIRRARLTEVKAIEERWQTNTVTVTLSREDAKKLGLLVQSPKQ